MLKMRKLRIFSLALLLSLLLVCNVGWCEVDFNGDADGLEIAASTDFDVSQLSISLWIKLDSYVQYAGLVVKMGDHAADDEYEWGFRMDDTDTGATVGKRLCYSDESGGNWDADNVYSETDIPLATWTHIGLTVDNSTTYIFYKDGVADGSGSPTDGLGTETRLIDIAWDAFGGDEYFDGKMFEIAVWSSILTAGEMSVLADSRLKRMPLQIQPANLVMYLPLDDVAEGVSIDGKTFFDMTGNGHTGTGTDADGDSVATGETHLSYPPD